MRTAFLYLVLGLVLCEHTTKSDQTNENTEESSGLDNLEEQVGDLRKMMHRLFETRKEQERGDIGAVLDDIADSVTKAAQCCRKINDMIVFILTGDLVNRPQWENVTHQDNWKEMMAIQQKLVGMNGRLLAIYHELLTLQKDVDLGCIDSSHSRRTEKCKNVEKDMADLELAMEISGFAWLLDKSCGVKEPIDTPKDCGDVLLTGVTASGPYEITLPSGSQVKVYCDMETAGGGWTVVQRRGINPEAATFNETFENYKMGFGDVTKDFWLGLDHISEMTTTNDYILRVDLEDWGREEKYTLYMQFRIDKEKDYELTAINHAGNGGDSLMLHNGKKFSTFDNDMDTSRFNCALECGSGWWFHSCADSNLNGIYGNAEETNKFGGVMWETFRGRHYSLRKVEMKIRKASGR